MATMYKKDLSDSDQSSLDPSDQSSIDPAEVYGSYCSCCQGNVFPHVEYVVCKHKIIFAHIDCLDENQNINDLCDKECYVKDKEDSDSEYQENEEEDILKQKKQQKYFCKFKKDNIYNRDDNEEFLATDQHEKVTSENKKNEYAKTVSISPVSSQTTTIIHENDSDIKYDKYQGSWHHRVFGTDLKGEFNDTSNGREPDIFNNSYKKKTILFQESVISQMKMKNSKKRKRKLSEDEILNEFKGLSNKKAKIVLNEKESDK